jgi:hypothetical protein
MVTVGACGSLSEGNAATGFGNDAGAEPPDSGSASDVTVGDAPGADSGNFDAGLGPDGADADTGTAPTGAMFVHALPDLPDLRFCWKLGGDAGVYGADSPFPNTSNEPSGNYPGLPVGSSVPLSDEQAGSMVGSDLVLIGISADWLAKNDATANCVTLMGGMTTSGSLASFGEPYYEFDLPNGIQGGTTNVVAFAGCTNAGLDPSASAARCGASYDPTHGNLHADDVPVPQLTSYPPGMLSLQAIQLSPAIADRLGDGGVATISFGAPDAMTAITTLSSEGTVGPSSITPVQLPSGDAATGFGALGFAIDTPGSAGADGGAIHLFLTLEQSLELYQGPMVDPATFYAQQDSFLVAVLGDPNGPLPFQSGSNYDGTGLHLMVLPLP